MTRMDYKPYVHPRPCLMCGRSATGVLCPLCAGTADQSVVRRGPLSIRLNKLVRPAAAQHWPTIEYLKFQPVLQESEDACHQLDGKRYLCLTLGDLHYHVYLTPFTPELSVLESMADAGHICDFARLWLPTIERLIDEAPSNQSGNSILPFTLVIGIDMHGTGPYGFNCDVLGRLVHRGHDMVMAPLFNRESDYA